MKSYLKKMLAVIIVGCMVLSLAACGGGGSAADKDTLIVEGIMSADYVCPMGQTNTYDQVVTHALYDTIVMLDKDANPAPMIAESWDVSEDGMTYTFHIREDAVYNDGSKIVAGDIKYVIDTVKAQDWGYFLGSVIGDVEAPDDATLVAKKANMGANLLYMMSSYGIAVPESVREQDPESYDKAPSVTSGPYTFVSKETDGTTKLTANENYYNDPKPEFTNVEIRLPIDAATSALALENDEIDILSTCTDPAQIKGLQDKGFNVGNPTDNWSSPAVVMMGERLSSDKYLRQAINHAINRESAITLANEGLGEPTKDMLSARTMGEYAGKVESLSYDLDKAQECIAKSNYNGEPITLSIYGNKALAESVQSDLKEIGVSVEIEQLDMNSWAQKMMSGEMEMTTADLGNYTSSLCDMLAFFTSDGLYGTYMEHDADYDKYVKGMKEATDKAVFDENAVKALERAADLSQVFALYGCVIGYAVGNNVVYDYPASGGMAFPYLNYVTHVSE